MIESEARFTEVPGTLPPEQCPGTGSRPGAPSLLRLPVPKAGNELGVAHQ